MSEGRNQLRAPTGAIEPCKLLWGELSAGTTAVAGLCGSKVGIRDLSHRFYIRGWRLGRALRRLRMLGRRSRHWSAVRIVAGMVGSPARRYAQTQTGDHECTGSNCPARSPASFHKKTVVETRPQFIGVTD
jgi:hypothetical protein